MDPEVTHSRLQDVYCWSYTSNVHTVHAVHGAKVEHKTKECNKSSPTRWEWRKNIHNSETQTDKKHSTANDAHIFIIN